MSSFTPAASRPLKYIMPIFKKGFKTQLDNHRLISILCNIRRRLDCIIYENINRNFVNNSILSTNQCDFFKKKNAEVACSYKYHIFITCIIMLVVTVASVLISVPVSIPSIGLFLLVN